MTKYKISFYNQIIGGKLILKRSALQFLQNWLSSSLRKPLIIRGARQVGKTWLVRHLAKLSKLDLIELNLEKNPQLITLFNSNDPKQILINLEAKYHHKISPQTTLLFLDEIQAAPVLIAKLRWFAEDMPELAVIAAGSLLEFVLGEHTFSMPVGRVSYMYLEPLSFEEFLIANNYENLNEYLTQFNFQNEISEVIHHELNDLFKTFILIGGMPAAISSWISDRSLTLVNQTHHDLLSTYRDDFAKYAKKIDTSILEEVMMSVPRMLGQKFVYSHVHSELSTHNIKQGLHLLNKAKVIQKVRSTSANGLPLSAEIKEKFFKEIFLDVGLVSAALGISLNQIQSAKDISLINSGGIAEQVVGQLLKTIQPYYIEPNLFYWLREEKGSNAEVDYIIQHNNKIIPVEVKAGSSGGLKSLHLFMGMKQYDMALRINSDLPSVTNVKVKYHKDKLVKYKLISIPFYLIGQISRLLSELM